MPISVYFTKGSLREDRVAAKAEFDQWYAERRDELLALAPTALPADATLDEWDAWSEDTGRLPPFVVDIINKHPTWPPARLEIMEAYRERRLLDLATLELRRRLAEEEDEEEAALLASLESDAMDTDDVPPVDYSDDEPPDDLPLSALLSD